MHDARKPAAPTGGVAAYYDRLASVYGDGEAFGARRAAVLSAIAPELAGAHAVLDVGCGNGTYAAEFRVRAPSARVVGADLSPEMLQAARRRLGAQTLLVQADATALPFRAGCFDLVFMSHVLQLVDDIEGCVAEVAACMASGGLWISTVGVSGWRETVGRLLGVEALGEIATLITAVRSRAPTDDQTRVAAACVRAGLQATWRSAPFSVTWPALEEWLRIRWLTLVDEAARARVEGWLEQRRPRSAGLTLSIAETLLVARKS